MLDAWSKTAGMAAPDPETDLQRRLTDEPHGTRKFDHLRIARRIAASVLGGRQPAPASDGRRWGDSCLRRGRKYPVT